MLAETYVSILRAIREEDLVVSLVASPENLQRKEINLLSQVKKSSKNIYFLDD